MFAFTIRSDFHRYNTRHASDLHIAPISDTKLAENTINAQGPIIWNIMNDNIKKCYSLPMFKTHVKNYILANYSSEISNNEYASIIWYITIYLLCLSDVCMHPHLYVLLVFRSVDLL